MRMGREVAGRREDPALRTRREPKRWRQGFAMDAAGHIDDRDLLDRDRPIGDCNADALAALGPGGRIDDHLVRASGCDGAVDARPMILSAGTAGTRNRKGRPQECDNPLRHVLNPAHAPKPTATVRSALKAIAVNSRQFPIRLRQLGDAIQFHAGQNHAGRIHLWRHACAPFYAIPSSRANSTSQNAASILFPSGSRRKQP